MAAVAGPVGVKRPFYPRVFGNDIRALSLSNKNRSPIDMRAVANNFGALTGTTPLTVDAGRYNQPHDWMNLLERYDGRAMILQSEFFSAALMNERGDAFLSAVAPILPMIEKGIEIHNREAYQIPFDMMALGGVPRKTMWREEVRTQRLNYYGRYQSLEFNYMTDLNFGQEALSDVMGLLITQGRLTLYVQAQLAVVAAALERSTRLYRNAPRYSLMLNQLQNYFSIVNMNPDDFAHRILTDRDPWIKINLIIVMEGLGRAFAMISKSSVPGQVLGYHYEFEAESAKFVYVMFDTMEAQATWKSPDGPINIIEAPSFRYSTEIDKEPEPANAFRGYTNLCEIVQMDKNIHDEDYKREERKRFDPVTYNQTDTSLTHEPISYLEALGACGVWNDYQTGTIAGMYEFGSALDAVIAEYNKPELRQAAVDYYTDNGPYISNDHPPPASDPNFKYFRRWLSTVTVYEDGRTKKIGRPHCLGSLPKRSVPTDFFVKTARFIRALWIQEGEPELVKFMKNFFPDGGAAAWTVRHPGRDRDPAVVRTVGFQNPLFRVEMPLAEVTERFQSPQTAAAYVRENKISLEGPLERVMIHVPDTHMGTFLALGHRATQELEASKEDDTKHAQVEQGIQNFTQALLNAKEKTTLPSIIDTISKKEYSFASLATKKLYDQRMAQSAKSLDASLLQVGKHLQTEFADHLTTAEVDAMDVDHDAGPTRPGSHQFGAGAFDPTAVGNRIDPKLSVIFQQRLEEMYTLSSDDKFTNILSLILCAAFSYNNLAHLYKNYGIHFFRFNFWRPFQLYRMFHAVGMVQGPQTMVTAISQPSVTPYFQGMEMYVNIAAHFFSAAIVREPNHFTLYPNIAFNGVMRDINVRCVRTRAEFQSAGTHKPSIWPEIIPLDETVLNTPCHMLNRQIARPNDAPNYKNPMSYHSGADLLAAFADREWLEKADVANMAGDIYNASETTLISLVGFTSLRLSYDTPSKRYSVLPGTSPRGSARQCESSQAHRVCSGASLQFTHQPTFTVPVI